MNLYHTKLNKDDRCLDLLLTEEEVINAFQRSLEPNNSSYICEENCYNCWSIQKPPKCTFWEKIMGICKSCEK